MMYVHYYMCVCKYHLLECCYIRLFNPNYNPIRFVLNSRELRNYLKEKCNLKVCTYMDGASFFFKTDMLSDQTNLEVVI